MTELAALLSASGDWPVQPSIRISTLDLSEASGQYRDYVVGECDRNHILRSIAVLRRSIHIVRKERPDVVVTTGSMPLAIFSLVARLFGSRIVWIDSISQIDRISLSGRLVMPFSDLFLVQWPSLEERYPKSVYRGELV